MTHFGLPWELPLLVAISSEPGNDIYSVRHAAWHCVGEMRILALRVCSVSNFMRTAALGTRWTAAAPSTTNARDS